jgi:putative ABC transport system permease protein
LGPRGAARLVFAATGDGGAAARCAEIDSVEGLAEVAGVVRDGKFRGYRETVHPCFYAPLAQAEAEGLNLEVRASGHANALAAAVRHEIRALDRDLQIPEAQTLRAFRDAGLGQERLSAALISGMGILAAVIATIGLYGVLAFTVVQCTREIGVRVALGAAPGQVLRNVMAEAMALIAAGLAIGFAAAALLARFIASLLFEISATDTATYAATAALLMIVGAAAAFVPARRASRVDPMVALRYE